LSTAPDLVLSDEEFDLLTLEEQDAYLALLQQEAESWSLTARQADAERLSGEVDELMYGGAAGGGKSDWLLWHVHRLSMEVPGHRSLMLRTVFPELRRSLIARSLEKIPAEHARYKVGDKEWHYHNGSIIEFGYLETEEDARQYLSAEYDCVAFDELTEFSERQYTMVRSRLRTTRAKRKLGARPHSIAATNPGQRGHSWVKSRFVIPTEYGRRIHTERLDDEHERHIAFVPARVDDNPYIDPDYIRNLKMLPEIEQRQYLKGDWDIFEGQYFSEFDRDLHVVKPFAIPASWPRIRGLDYGYAAPFACVWIAFDWDRNAYVYRERYQAGLTATEQAKMVLSSSVRYDDRDRPVAELIDYTMADPSVWATTGSGISIASQYRDAGLICKKAMNARVDGWQRLRGYLAKQHDGTAGLRIFPACADLLRTLPELVYDQKRTEDLDTRGDDHLADALRYALMSRPRKAPPDPRSKAGVEAQIDRDIGHKLASRRRHPILGKL
jgi:hypothetical protein